MFWGLVLKTNKRYSQRVTKTFHVSQATLDLNTLSDDKDAVVQVWLHTDDTDHLLANFSRLQANVHLDLAFTEGETVAFYSKGSGTVHLTGYLVPDDDDFNYGDMDGEEESEDEDLELPEAPTKKQKAKKTSVAAAEQEEDDDNGSDDLDFEGLANELEDDEEDSDDEDGEEEEDDDDDDEDDDEDDEEDEDEDEEEVAAPPAKQAKLDKGAKQNGLQNGQVKKDQAQKNQKQDFKQEQKQKGQQNQQQPQKSGPKTLASGVIVHDLTVGKGPEAKSGKKVVVYYEGRLKSNNKVFDSTKSGKGFKFTLGKGEVIPGWDIGVVGMKVGSKRRVTCPPNAAYGPKGAPPSIPGNATLVFDIELRGVN